jgi:hypothetical protein
MFGLLKDAIDFTGDVIGTTIGIAVAPIALALGVSERLVRRAVNAGCKTQREIKDWIEENE